nr:Hpt domain-containing protein [Lachnospiraceae bacterium]
TGIDYTGGGARYASSLQRFYNNYEKNRTKVETFFQEKDYENLMITVHALKSNAKMIGATELSSGFESLETAARENDGDFIEQMTPITMNAYKELIEKLAPISQLGEIRAVDEISAEEARETADKLLEALDDFDDELSKKLVAKLSGYPFRITWSEKLKEASDLINDFMYEEAADIIRELYGVIE